MQQQATQPQTQERRATSSTSAVDETADVVDAGRGARGARGVVVAVEVVGIILTSVVTVARSVMMCSGGLTRHLALDQAQDQDQDQARARARALHLLPLPHHRHLLPRHRLLPPLHLLRLIPLLPLPAVAEKATEAVVAAALERTARRPTAERERGIIAVD